jgi:leucyl-tRNA synthetase
MSAPKKTSKNPARKTLKKDHGAQRSKSANVRTHPHDHKTYAPDKIEGKWQKEWEKSGIYEAKDNSKKPKFYGLIEFPYPSGAGLHTGHIRSNTAMDIISRKRRMEGYNVLYPIGWDAFGLPTENYAIKTGIPPAKVTKQNTDTFRRQLKALGFSFDWSREINTTDPKYYTWTQWIFLQMYKHNLAYKAKMAINWCPKDKIGLANEEVIDGKCERCGAVVEKREKEQWMLAITKYADRLDHDLDTVDYLEKIKIQQRNWIGRSEGAIVTFPLVGKEKAIHVFTTRIDTIFSGTFVILAPEHPLIGELKENIKNWKDVEKYILHAKLAAEKDRLAEGNKTGVELKGVTAKNPATGAEMPVWVADFVLGQYGTGAVFADAHDKRDFDMAKKYGIPLKISVRPQDDSARFERIQSLEECFEDDGVLVNSGEFDGMSSAEARPKITKWLAGFGFAEATVKYKLRDWVFSRQRYWGEPIPMVHCGECGWQPVPEKDLPVLLPEVKKYQPADNGESPLAAISKWVNTTCPKCKGKAKRETDTMPQWAGSSWYYLRYTDPHDPKIFASKKSLEHWMPVDWYNGGMEHTTLHLLYSRFWHKFLYDIGLVGESEPFKKRTSHGLILAEGGEKMSKSKGNTVSPDEIVQNVGADTLRVYEMFMGPFDQPIAWSTDNMVGSRRFLEKVWNLKAKISANKKFIPGREIESSVHKTIKKVAEDIESMSFNTAVSSLMILANEFDKAGEISMKHYETLLKLLAPFAPHLAEEQWHELGHARSVHLEAWPEFDPELISSGERPIAFQVNGKFRASFKMGENASEEEVKKEALALEEAKKWIGDKEIKRIVFVKNRLINFLVGEK